MLRTLRDKQVAAFDPSDWDQGCFERWMRIDEIEELLTPYIASHSGARLLDLGGGTGRFVDILLPRHGSCSAVVGDSSELLLSRNKPHPRKATLLVNAVHLTSVFPPQSCDVIFIHRLLHHLVGDSYGESIQLIRDVLGQCATIIRHDGRLSVIENVWDGRFIDSSASRLLYYATSSHMAASVARRLGANTAGTGVCYLSDRSWKGLFAQVGFRVETEQVFAPLRERWLIQLPTLLKRGRSMHYWCRPM
jgi:SAM-dependent methyltransferase